MSELELLHIRNHWSQIRH